MVCRVFKKKSHKLEEQLDYGHTKLSSSCGSAAGIEEPKNSHIQEPYNEYSFDGCMQLPQLFSPESSVACPLSQLATTPIALNATAECPQNNIWRLSCGPVQQERLNTDWSFLNRLLAADQQPRTKSTLSDQLPSMGHPNSKKFSFPFPYSYPHPHLGSTADFFKFSK